MPHWTRTLNPNPKILMPLNPQSSNIDFRLHDLPLYPLEWSLVGHWLSVKRWPSQDSP